MLTIDKVLGSGTNVLAEGRDRALGWEEHLFGGQVYGSVPMRPGRRSRLAVPAGLVRNIQPREPPPVEPTAEVDCGAEDLGQPAGASHRKQSATKLAQTGPSG